MMRGEFDYGIMHHCRFGRRFRAAHKIYIEKRLV
jgi:hypothetical protein